MIKRLKRKYIFIVMIAVTVVLSIIITAINIASYTAVNSQLEEKLTLIVENEGKMPDFPLPEMPSDDEDENVDGEENTETGDSADSTGKNDKDKDKDKEKEEEEDVRQHMSPETPFETRYFTVKFNTDGTVSSVDTTKIAAVDANMAEKYAKEIFESESSRGYFETYKYMRGTAEDGSILYVFLDANRELKSVRSFIAASVGITLIGIVMIFILVVLLADFTLKPITESYEKQKRFITDAGHEMKTPLTVISANAEVIEMENGESQWTEGIKSQVSKLASLTEKLVILSKMEEGIKLEMIDFSVSEALYEVSDQYKSIAMSRGVSFNLNIDDGARINGNEVEIRRCLTLLLDNAFRYVNEGGVVDVSAHKVVNGVELKFTNTTSGVQKGSLDRWFDRFYRTDLSRNSDTGGSGIGLSVVQAIVQAHGGSIHAYSDDGETVEFTVNL